MARIKVQSQISTPVFILYCIISIVIIGIVVKFIFFDSTLSYHTKSNGYELIFLLLFFVPLLFRSTGKQEYVSELVITNNELDIIYKRKNTLVNTKRIPIDSIESFNVSVDLNNVRYSRTTILSTRIITEIQLKNKDTITFDNTYETKFFGCPYQYILDIIKASALLPNFSLNLTGNSEFDKENIQYFRRFGKTFPFMLAAKYRFKLMPKSAKTVVVFFAIIYLFIFCMFLYINVPSPLSKQEKQYFKIYSAAMDLKRNKNYSLAIQKLNEAQSIINTSSDSYLQKAYCYKYLKQYNSCIAEAKEGLKYADKKSIYYKAKNFKFSGDDKIALNTVLGDCGLKSKNYNDSIYAFTYVINNVKYIYTDAYFKRGRAYYYLGQYNLALSDFIMHKSIIEQCLQSDCSRYKAKNLNNINKWIAASQRNMK